MTGGVSGGVDGTQGMGAFTRTACPAIGPSEYISDDGDNVCQGGGGVIAPRKRMSCSNALIFTLIVGGLGSSRLTALSPR